nr:head completion/stabilization protein [Iodobacter ciconiae]
MGFIAAQKSGEILEPLIKNSGFWPDIDMTDAQISMRMDGTVTPQRLKMALIAAMASANQDLRKYKARQIGLGVSDLIDVDSETIDGRSVLVGHYIRAVTA